MKLTVFALGAHPDDIEFFMAGTLFLFKKAGHDIHYMNLADGSQGSTIYDEDTIVRMRREEAMAAADYLGAVYHGSLVKDTEIFYERETLFRLTSVIREINPDILLLHSPQDYMEDHMNACRLGVSAAFFRGALNYSAVPYREPVSKDIALYHCQSHLNRDMLGNVVWPEYFVDISDVIEEKTSMLANHQSQREWLDKTQGMDSYLLTMKSISSELGEMSGQFAYAEGWRAHLHIGYGGENYNPLYDILKERIIINEHYRTKPAQS